VPIPASLQRPIWESDLIDALSAQPFLGLSAIADRYGAEHPDVRVLTAALDGVFQYELYNQRLIDAANTPGATDGTAAPTDPVGELSAARDLLSWALTQDLDLKTHPFVQIYLTEAALTVYVAAGVTAALTISHDLFPLVLAEMHLAAGDFDHALTVLETAAPTHLTELMLVDIYSEAGRHQDVLDTTVGITNTDDVGALLLVYRGRALCASGFLDASHTTLTEALRIRSRDPHIRNRAFLERAQTSIRQHKYAAARKDLESVMAVDQNFTGLAALMAQLPTPPSPVPKDSES